MTQTGEREKRMIPVVDIVEIEHLEETRFVVRYNWQRNKQGRLSTFDQGRVKVGDKVAAVAKQTVNNILRRIKEKAAERARKKSGVAAVEEEKSDVGVPDNDKEEVLVEEDRDDIFDSKYVKEIIETYENVMVLMRADEADLKRFIAEEDGDYSGDGEADYYDEEDDDETDCKKPPKVYKATLKNHDEPPRVKPKKSKAE